MSALALQLVLSLVLLSCSAVAREGGSGAPPRADPASPDLAEVAVLPVREIAALPVREVTVFKDGHAFVLREGTLATDEKGDVVLDDLPAPVLGTFWPYASAGTRLVSATAARTRVRVERTALDLRQLLEANIGAPAVIVDANNERTEGLIAALPARSGEELERNDPTGTAPRLPEKGAVVLVKNAEGTKAIHLDRVRDITIKGEPKFSVTIEELRNRLTLHLSGEAGRPPGKSAKATVGLVYVQKGLRWIPAYQLDVDGAGKAAVKLEATLVNDLVDLEDVTVNLVIGVPRFEFKDLVDPIALQEAAANVGRQLQEQDRFSNALSNSITTQSASFREPGEGGAAPVAPEALAGESNEDLFVFTVRHVTLARGVRLVLPVSEFVLAYRDVFTLDVPFAPPVEMREQFQNQRVTELATLLAAPKAMHVLRLKNDTSAPLTTAPALILAGGKVLAQGRMTYTPIGAESDLSVTTAVDIGVEKSEKESGRTPAAVRWNNDDYHRIDMTGAIELTNRKKEAVEIEVRRTVLGLADIASATGTVEQKGLLESWSVEGQPPWWSWWSWPYWWQHWNGIGRFTWKVRLGPGEKTSLTSNWHYFWR